MIRSAARAVAVTLAFVLELAMLLAFAIFGAHTSPNSALGGLVAGLLVITAASLWGTFLAPKAPRRLGWPGRVIAEMSLIGLSAVALYTTGRVQGALAFGAAIIVRFAIGLATGVDRLEAAPESA